MYWRQWLQTLLSLAILLGILEMLLPSGELAKYAKLVLGLALMLAVLEPVTILLNLDIQSIDLSWQDGLSSEPDVEALAARVKLAAAAPFLMEEKVHLSAQLEGVLSGLEGVNAVWVEVSSAEEKSALISIFLDPFEADLAGSIGQIAASLLHVPVNQISVQRWADKEVAYGRALE